MPKMLDKNAPLFQFMKMHGLGNDFVVVDARVHPLTVTESMARALGDRHCGVGFDQLAVITHDTCLLYTSPSPRDKRQSRMPSSA